MVLVTEPRLTPSLAGNAERVALEIGRDPELRLFPSSHTLPPPLTMTYETRLFINNEYCTPLKQETFPLRNPATEKHLADISIATKEDVDHAVDCAEAAQPAWAALPVHERVKAMYKLADLLDQHAEKIVEVSLARRRASAKL